MIYLSAFADEISPDLEEQISVLQEEAIHHVDLRSAWDTNILDLDDRAVARVKQALDESGISVACIASPLGKVSIDEPEKMGMRRLDRAIALTRIFDTASIRIFSFYPARREPLTEARYRDEALRRVRAMVERADAAGVMLLHENDTGLYGDTVARCVDVLQNAGGRHLRAVFDPANFIQCGEKPYPDALTVLQPWLQQVHVKDALGDGTVVPAGKGAAHWEDILHRLREERYTGFFSLEPHLAAAEQYRGFSGPDLFRVAARSFRRLLEREGWEYA